MISIRFDRVVRGAVLASMAIAVGTALLGAVWLRVAHASGGDLTAGFVRWTLLAGLATSLLSIAMSPAFGRAPRRLPSIGLANALTLGRFVLAAPAIFLLLARCYPEALFVYIVLAATDILDGIVARRRRQSSEFGVIADPLADVISTFAVFSVLTYQGLCPTWVYAILCIRYAMLLLGSLGLFLATGPLHFTATLPGKIVGVVQAVGGSAIIFGARIGGLPAAPERVLFAFLGIGFASIVISQALIGWRFVRRTSRSGLTR